MSGQFNGLIIKNLQLMKRQKGTLCCQVITPLLCLGFIALIKLIVETQIKKTGINLKVQMPILFNVPIYSKFQYTKGLIRITNCEEWYMYAYAKDANTSAARSFFGQNDGQLGGKTSGMLKSQHGVIQAKCDQLGKMTPYFQEAPGNKTINEELYDRIEELNKDSFKKLSNESSLTRVPDGALTINSLNETEFSYKLQINDNRMPPYHRTNGITKLQLYNENTGNFSHVMNVVNGMLWAVDLFDRAYFKNFFPDVFVISGVQLMPFTQDSGDENIQRVINLAGSTFYPMAISLLMPLFMYTIVLEKESKLVEIMKINGMKMRFYWLANFAFNFCLYALTMSVFNLVGALALGLSLFVDTSPLLMFVIFFGWGLCQVAMAFFFQAFLSNARSATIIGYIISMWTTLLAVSLNMTIFDLPKRMPTWLLCYPTFNITRIFYHLTMKCGYTRCIPNMSDLEPELRECLVLLYVTPWMFMFLGLYLYEIIPQQFGVRKHPLFCLKGLRRRRTAVHQKKEEYEAESQLEVVSITSTDEEVNTEASRVLKIDQSARGDYPLIVSNLTKVYKPSGGKQKPKRALNGLNLLLQHNEIFGLLGPNGAGKTTFFNLLTGIYEPTAGDAWVGGSSIKEKIGAVQQVIGYCPQFDLLWEDLSVEEHLYFYSRLKNVRTTLKLNVEKTLEDIKLGNFKDFLVKELSGGMKRRLSLGISLVGNPATVFLDEPTTGLDPENKRQIWEILSDCKKQKCMILTTHLMEEAEVLSDRIGIIVGGQLRCLGSQYKLKKIYGKGFKLIINLTASSPLLAEVQREEQAEERIQGSIKFVKGLFPSALLHEQYKSTLIFEIPNEEFDAEVLFNNIEESKDGLSINNWAISQVTLEDIFIKLTENEV